MEFKIGGKVRLKKTIAYSDGDVPSGTICILAKTSDLISEIIDPLGRKWTITTESIEPATPTISEIINKEMSCVIHTKTKDEAELLAGYMPQTSSWSRNPCDNWDYYGGETGYYIANGKLAQYARTSFYEANYPEYGEIYEFSDLFVTGGKIPAPSKPVSIEEQLGLPKGISIHDLDMTSLYRPMNIEIQPLELVCNEEQAKEIAERLNEEPAGRFNAFPNDGISAKNGGKNTMNFTFYVKEGTRADKSCNGTIPTMTTMVSYIDKYGCIMKGTATCDKADYDERQGVLEALANATCGDNFYKAYAEAIKFNRCEDELSRTCAYCGQLLDTREEREEHEAWHAERRKARHERYLLRKRAKEIAFEEQAQKMAKEMMGEQK